mgnify:CR=1 FL=1
MTATATAPKRKKLDLTIEMNSANGGAAGPRGIAIHAVRPEGRIKRVGYQVECHDCGWSSFRYDQRSTAELIRDSHAERCLGGK